MSSMDLFFMKNKIFLATIHEDRIWYLFLKFSLILLIYSTIHSAHFVFDIFYWTLSSFYKSNLYKNKDDIIYEAKLHKSNRQTNINQHRVTLKLMKQNIRVKKLCFAYYMVLIRSRYHNLKIIIVRHNKIFQYI